MTYLDKLSELQSDINRILLEEYKHYIRNENMKVKELLNRIRCRIGNSIVIEHLYNGEIKKR